MYRELLSLQNRTSNRYVFSGSDISYWPVPKNACTSMKKILFEYNYGSDFHNINILGKLIHIHHSYPAILFSDDRFKIGRNIAIFRDPMERFISLYCNRVVYYRDLNKNTVALSKLDLPVNPSINCFIDHLEIYRDVSESIFNHSCRQIDYLGKDKSKYTLIVDIKNMSLILEFLNDHLSKFSLQLPMTQSGGSDLKKITKSEMTISSIKKIESYYNNDFDLFGR